MVRIGTGIGKHYPGSTSGEVFNNYSTNIASGRFSHAEGHDNKAIGDMSHAEGVNTRADGIYSHTEGIRSYTVNEASHAEGSGTTAAGRASHAEGCGTKANANYSHAEGYITTANGDYSHAEGLSTSAIGNYSHAEGYYTTANGDSSHAEGNSTTASGDYSHAEGNRTTANGRYSHAEGWDTIASGDSSHAEGRDTIANGNYSHAEGWGTIASGYSSHAEGNNTKASGNYSHAGGLSSSANGKASFSQGEYLLSQNEGEAAMGVRNSSVYTSMLEGELTARATLFSVGMGVDGTARNAMELKYNGDLYLFGAGNYNGRNSLGNAAYDSTVQTVQSLLGGGSTVMPSGNKALVCNTTATALTKTVTDSSVKVEEGTIVTVWFKQGSSASSVSSRLTLSVNGISAPICAPHLTGTATATRYMPPIINQDCILSFMYDSDGYWHFIGNPVIATGCKELISSQSFCTYVIFANRMTIYFLRQVVATPSNVTHTFPIPFSEDYYLTAVATGMGTGFQRGSAILNLSKTDIQVDFAVDGNNSNERGGIIVAGMI